MEFTVVATTFNDSKGITKYLDSIMSQTLLPKEIIIADGGSKDDTVRVIQEYADGKSVKITVDFGKRLNIAEGYNTAIRLAKTDVILITGIGNLYENTYAEKLVTTMENTDAEIVHGVIRGQDNGWFSRIYNKAYLRGDKGKIPFLPSNRGVLIKKSVFDRVGYFYEKFIYAGEDTEFFLNTLNAGIKTESCDAAILYWDTPHTFKEDKKKTKMYALSKWQFMDNKKTIRSQAIKMLFPIIALAVLVIFITKWYVWALYALGYCTFAMRLKSFNPFVIGLRFVDDFLDSYYYFATSKYGKPEYKVKR